MAWPTDALGALAIVAIVATLAVPALVAGADPSPSPAPSPTPRQPTCDELYPDPGPGGLDLRLACIVRELVGHYTGTQPTGPARISEYLLPMAAIVAIGVGLFLAAQYAMRRTSEALAPVLPSEWWLCPACASVNQPAAATCYSCRAPRPPDAAIVPTAEHPIMTQRFGGDRKKGGDRPGRGPGDAPP